MLVPKFFNQPFDPTISPDNNIFNYVETQAAQAGLVDKCYHLTRKIKEIRNLQLVTWNRNKHPSVIDFIINFYYARISHSIPYLSAFEKVCFIFTVFHQDLRIKILKATQTAAAELARSHGHFSQWIDERHVKKTIIPVIARELEPGNFVLSRPQHQPEVGHDLSLLFEKLLEIHEIENEVSISEFTNNSTSTCSRGTC